MSDDARDGHDAWGASLSGYLDGELSAGARRAVEGHLRECARCAALLQEMRRVVRRAAGLSDIAPRRDLWPSIAARLAGARRAPRRRWRDPDARPLRPELGDRRRRG